MVNFMLLNYNALAKLNASNFPIVALAVVSFMNGLMLFHRQFFNKVVIFFLLFITYEKNNR